MRREIPGHVYTRLLEKCCTGLGPLKEYTLELEILEVLLSQRFWRRGKRGKLYERRALVQTKYLCDKDEDPAVLQKKRQKALDGLYEALQDDDTRLGMYQRSTFASYRIIDVVTSVPTKSCPSSHGVGEAAEETIRGQIGVRERVAKGSRCASHR